MFRRKSNKIEPKKKKAWQEDVEADNDDGTHVKAANEGPSEAFLSLQKELDAKEAIQRENEDRAKRQHDDAAHALKKINEKAERMRANRRNPRVFFDIEVSDDTTAGSHLKKGKRVGRITFELFDDKVPRTAENFRALCTGEKPRGASGFPLNYLGNVFHRIVPKFVAQGGDITREDGSGGESIYGATFADEGFELKHDRPGLLSMANSGRNTNNSQFFITFDALPWLDANHVVFGKVIDGMEIVRQIEDCGTTSGEPTKRVQIGDCGQIAEDGKDDVESQGDEPSRAESSGDEDSRRRGKRARVSFATENADAGNGNGKRR